MEFVQDPAPPLHVAPVAPPPVLPPIAAEVPLWQIAVNEAPAVAVGGVFTVMVFVAVAFVHPVGAVAVKVSVIEPDSDAPAV